MKYSKLLCALWAVTFLYGCDDAPRSDLYATRSVGSVSKTYKGVIINARQVDISNADKKKRNAAIGAAAGGVGGAAVGHFAGKHEIVGGAIGALAGAGVGLATARKKTYGLEYSVQLADSSILTVVQGADNPLAIGAKVLVIVNQNGDSRVIPYDGTAY